MILYMRVPSLSLVGRINDRRPGRIQHENKLVKDRGQRLKLSNGAAALDQLDCEIPPFRKSFNAIRHEKRGRGIEQHRVSFGAAFLAAQDAFENFRIHHAVTADQIIKRARLDGKLCWREIGNVKPTLLIKFRDAIFSESGKLIEKRDAVFDVG